MAPDFVTHYYLPSRMPFQNLSDLNDDDVLVVMNRLNEERREGRHHRLFGKKYIDLRREAERRLRNAFVDIGGKPARRAPHYFVLGESAWFRGLAPDMAELRLPLAALPTDATTVTYGDSMYATGVSSEHGFGPAPDEAHTKVHRLADVRRLLDDLGLPDDAADEDYTGYEHRSVVRFVEVQVWCDLEGQ